MLVFNKNDVKNIWWHFCKYVQYLRHQFNWNRR